MKTNTASPSIYVQNLRRLPLWRLYSFRMFSADHKNMSRKKTHAVTTQFNNATLIPEKCFTHLGSTRDRKQWMNWHVAVFRAKGTTGTLRVSD